MSHVGPIGVTPRPSPCVDCSITGTLLPFTTVVPSRLEVNGSTCATWCAYSGAERHNATIRTSSRAIASAIRFRRSRRQASCHGPRATAARSPAWAGTSPTTAPLTEPPGVRLLHPGLVDQPVELLAEDEVADALRHEVDVPRREQRRHRRLVGDLMVDLRPERVRRGEVRLLELQRLVHLVVDRLVAEPGDVDARVAARVERLTTEEHVQEVRRSRVVLVPLLDVDLHLVLRVL